MDKYKYLGVILQDKRVKIVTSKGRRALALLGRVLRGTDKKVKEKGYKTIVRPILEYAAAVWDPYLGGEVVEIEKGC